MSGTNVGGEHGTALMTSAMQRGALLALVVDSSDDAIVLKSADGTITGWNHGAEVVYGYTAAEMLGKSATLLVNEDRPNEIDEIFATIRNGGRVKHFETLRIRKDGRRIAVSLTVSPIHDAHGKMVGISSIARDVTERKRAEDLVGAPLRYAQSLIESNLDFLVTISAEGKITDINEGSIAVTGVPRESLIGTDFSNYFTNPERAREAYQRVFTEGFVSDFPLTIRHRDGRLTEVLYNASVHRDPQGHVLGVFAAARDINHLKEASADRSRLAAIVQSSMDAIVSKTLEGIVKSWNRGADIMFGYDAHEIIGRHVSVLIPPHLRADEQKVLEKVGRGERVEHYESQRVRKSGEIFDVSLMVSPIQNLDGQIIGLSKIAREITAQKQASHYARSLVEASLDPLVTISPEGKITDVNEGSIKVTGIEREQLIGTDFSTYFTRPEKAREGYQQVFSKGFVTDYPLTIRHKDGRRTDVLYNASVFKDLRGNVLGVLATARDVTAQKAAEAELVQQHNKELERLAELERFQRLTVGRELKMIELKLEIAELKKQVAGIGDAE